MAVGLVDSIILRAVTPSDEPFLRDVYASTRAEELKQVPWNDDQKREFTDMQFTAQDTYYREHYPTAQFLVIEVEGAAVGRLYIDRWETEIRIMDIALLPQFRGAGTGTHLLHELQEEARASKKVLSIHVEKFNPALRLYDRLGFLPKEDKGVYLLMEWQP